MIKLIRKMMPPAIRRPLRELRFELFAFRTHKKSIKEARKFNGQLLKLNFGCEKMLKSGWVNVDLTKEDCLNCDLRRDLVFNDESVTEIYSEYFLEHLSIENAQNFIRETLRVLVPGGRMTVGVPDAQVLLESYVNGLDPKEFKFNATFPENPTRMEIVNRMFKGFRHENMYDFETLEKALAMEGYENIQRRKFDPERDSAHREDWTLYVDAFKPKEANNYTGKNE